MIPQDAPQDTSAWMARVSETAKSARERYPESGNRINAGLRLVYDGKVTQHDDGSYTVGSDTKGGKETYHVEPREGTCSCRDWQQAPDHFCKHRFAAAFWHRAKGLLAGVDEAPPDEEAPLPEPPPPEAPLVEAPDMPTILLPYLVWIKQKPFVKFAGLLLYAQQQGLLVLKAKLVSVTPDLAIATAIARFQDGRCYADAADATPKNVGSGVSMHFPRVALTRAKSRCLRDALGVAAVAWEELEFDDPDHPQKG